MFDAREPAACQYYYPHLGLMIDLTMRALAPALPEVVVAGPGGRPDEHHVHRPPRTAPASSSCAARRPPSAGARTRRATAPTASSTTAAATSRTSPSRSSSRSTRSASTATGCWEGSGGAGAVPRRARRRARVRDAGRRTSACRSGSSARSPRGRGLFGGEDGRKTSVLVDRGDGPQEILKVNRLPLPEGSRITVRTGGGGGYGDPAERDPDALEQDVLDGYVRRSEGDQKGVGR